MALGGLKDESDLKRWVERAFPALLSGAENRSRFKELAADPAAPEADTCILYAKDSGGKTALFVRFPTGSPVQIAIEP